MTPKTDASSSLPKALSSSEQSADQPIDRPGLLIVDDEVHNLDSLERLFRESYKIFRALSGEEALESLSQNRERIQVVISDQRMPGLSGVEFFQKSLDIKSSLIRILLTGYTDIEALIDAINEAQIYRYLNKPWDPIDLRKTVDQAFEKFNLEAEIQLKNKELQVAYNELKSLDLAKSQFMILINHELKTPLTSILSYSQMLKEEKLTPEQLKWNNRILEAGEKLQQLVHDSLILMSAETKTLELKIQKFSLDQLEIFSNSSGLSSIKQKIKIEDSNLLPTEVRCIGDVKWVNVAIEKILQHILHFQEASSASPTAMFSWKLKGTNRVGFEFRYDHAKKKNNVSNPAATPSGQTAKSDPLPYETPQVWLNPFHSDANWLHHRSFTGMSLPLAHSVLKLFQSSLQLSKAQTTEQVVIQFELTRIGSPTSK